MEDSGSWIWDDYVNTTLNVTDINTNDLNFNNNIL